LKRFQFVSFLFDRDENNETAGQHQRMDDGQRRVLEAAAFLKERTGKQLCAGLLTGTGLGETAAFLQVHHRFAYSEIPHFPVSTVRSHDGRLLIGTHDGKWIAVMQGRLHLYEGYRPAQVAFPVRVLQELGVGNVILTNAAGGLNPAYSAGQIMVIRDHINLTGENPLVGPNVDRWGIRFPDMTAAYDKKWRESVFAAAAAMDMVVHEGVYAGLKGPSLETPAEIRFLKIIGADAVGLSTIQEVIAAVHAGMRILGLSIITNINDPDHPQPATIEEIITTANQASPGLQQIIQHALEALDGTPES
jgi:purine-nucleoside phosphorylase